MEQSRKFKVLISEEVDKFLSTIPIKARAKIIFNLEIVAGGKIDSELFKKLKGTDIWEFRTTFNHISYRILSFWDTKRATLVVTTHGFIKKQQKTPKKEIKRAEEIKNEYIKNFKQ